MQRHPLGARRGRRTRAVVTVAAGALALAVTAVAAARECTGDVYLTLDTGNMRHAEDIAAILRR